MLRVDIIVLNLDEPVKFARCARGSLDQIDLRLNNICIYTGCPKNVYTLLQPITH